MEKLNTLPLVTAGYTARTVAKSRLNPNTSRGVSKTRSGAPSGWILLTSHGGVNELIQGSNAIVRQITMVGQGVQTRTGPSLIGLAWSLPSMFASGVDQLGLSIETWSNCAWQRSTPRRSNLGVLLLEILVDVREGVRQACGCEADDCSGLHRLRSQE